MRNFFNEHFDILMVSFIATLLIVVYFVLLAFYQISDEAIKTLMISTVGGAVGIGTGRSRAKSSAVVQTAKGDVTVRQEEE